MNIRLILSRLVPASWSGDDALTVVDILEQLSDAIWLAHGQAMHEATKTWRFSHAQPLHDLDREPRATDFDDDLPF
jgi:hypothetical protein